VPPSVGQQFRCEPVRFVILNSYKMERICRILTLPVCKSVILGYCMLAKSCVDTVVFVRANLLENFFDLLWRLNRLFCFSLSLYFSFNFFFFFLCCLRKSNPFIVVKYFLLRNPVTIKRSVEDWKLVWHLRKAVNIKLEMIYNTGIFVVERLPCLLNYENFPFRKKPNVTLRWWGR